MATVIPDVGFPVGRPQTIAISLAGTFLSPSRDVRLLTNMRIYWDQILVADGDRPARPKLTRLDAVTADLHWRGFSREVTPDGREPIGYDYQRVSSATTWKRFVGRYTGEGDVSALLRSVDDMFVILASRRRNRVVVRRDHAPGACIRMDANVPPLRARLQQGDEPALGQS